MPLYTVDGKLLVRFGKLAAGADCCDCACKCNQIVGIDLHFDSIDLCKDPCYKNDIPTAGSYTLTSDSDVNDTDWEISVVAGIGDHDCTYPEETGGGAEVQHYLEPDLAGSLDTGIGGADVVTVSLISYAQSDTDWEIAIAMQVGVSGGDMPAWLFFGTVTLSCVDGEFEGATVNNLLTSYCAAYEVTDCPGLGLSGIPDRALVLGKNGHVHISPRYA